MATPTQATFTIDNVAPTVTISSFPNVNIANSGAVTLDGSCSEEGGIVSVTVGSMSGTSICNTGLWLTTLNLSSETATGATADHTDLAGNTATQATATNSRDVVAPTVAISSFSSVNIANSGAVTLTGTCSTGDGNVTVAVGAVNATPTCSAGTWTTTLNLTGESSTGATADQTDAAGNAAIQATATNTRDIVAPTITIVSTPNSVNS